MCEFYVTVYGTLVGEMIFWASCLGARVRVGWYSPYVIVYILTVSDDLDIRVPECVVLKGIALVLIPGGYYCYCRINIYMLSSKFLETTY